MGAVQLAWARVVVAAVVLGSADVHRAVAWAAALSPDQLGPYAPFASPPVAWTAYALTVGGAALGLVGVRRGFVAATLGLLVLLGLRQLGSGPVHAHHLVWMTAILAASPCDDAWAPGAGPPVTSPAHDAAVRALLGVLGVVYLFPGLHKLAGDWVTGDALVQTLWWKWAQSPDFTPAVRLDTYPALARAVSIGIVAFELAVGPALQWRPTRVPAAVAIVAFHAGTALLADVHFGALWALALIALPVDAPGEPVERPVRPVAVAAAVVLGPAVVAGLLGAQHAWPWACYPTFADAPGTWMPTVVITDPAGEVVAVDGPQRLTGELWSLGTPADAAAFAARHPEVPAGATFRRAARSVIPGDDRLVVGAPFAVLTPGSGAPAAAR